MKKIKTLNVLIIILLFTSCFNTEENAEKILRRHLKDRYGEEFVILPMREREVPGRRWYESGIIYPESYIGTRKEDDSYYWGKGFVRAGSMEAGDTYGGVLLNESANRFYGKKLKELFGENYLAVLNVEGGYISTDFEEEMRDRKNLYEEDPEGKFLPLSGGIYIFGRVENDEDREWYRKQIYEFIQFMKETGTFEYVDLDILIVDERFLLDEFQHNSIGTLTKLEEIAENTPKEEFLKKRKNIMNELNIYFENSKDYKENLEKINKSELRKEGAALYTKGNNLLYLKVYSPKHIKIQGYKKEIRDYGTITDVKFNWERWF